MNLARLFNHRRSAAPPPHVKVVGYVRGDEGIDVINGFERTKAKAGSLFDATIMCDTDNNEIKARRIYTIDSSLISGTISSPFKMTHRRLAEPDNKDSPIVPPTAEELALCMTEEMSKFGINILYIRVPSVTRGFITDEDGISHQEINRAIDLTKEMSGQTPDIVICDWKGSTLLQKIRALHQNVILIGTCGTPCLHEFLSAAILEGLFSRPLDLAKQIVTQSGIKQGKNFDAEATLERQCVTAIDLKNVQTLGVQYDFLTEMVLEGMIEKALKYIKANRDKPIKFESPITQDRELMVLLYSWAKEFSHTAGAALGIRKTLDSMVIANGTNFKKSKFSGINVRNDLTVTARKLLLEELTHSGKR